MGEKPGGSEGEVCVLVSTIDPASHEQILTRCSRTPWQGDADSIARIKTEGKKNSEGYVNVASQLGLSRRRDTSTYHQYWLHRQERMSVYRGKRTVKPEADDVHRGYDVGGYDDEDYEGDY